MSRTALVTGGSRGIGAAISTALKDAGYSVAATYAGNDEAAAKFTDETGIKTYKWNVADYDESAAGIAHVEEIAASSPRMAAMSLGAADFAASMGMQTTGIGGTQENYYMLHGDTRHFSDPWHWAQTAIVAACRTHGVLPVDGPFGDFSDDEGYRAQAKRSATLGMVGKWAIHPSQIAMANDVFSPPEAEVEKAERIIEELRTAEAAGKGAASLDGKMIDAASEKMARNLIDTANAIAAKTVPAE